MIIAEVRLWGRTIGAVSWDPARALASFEYEAAFTRSQIQVAPVKMPLSDRIYTFPGLARESFHGLPGLLADSLPDDFGNALINSWLASEGRDPRDFTPVERLCYIGSRGMGALEFAPAQGPDPKPADRLNLDALVSLAGDILSHRGAFSGNFNKEARKNTLNEILRVGTSAGGARAKAIIAWNPATSEVRSGQVDLAKGFEHWLLKLDGVSGNRDKELEDPKGYGLIEFAYYNMARAAGISMSESRLLKENGRSHFMTRRFDRTSDGHKLHMQSLAAMQHFNYHQPGAYSYEQALQTMKMLSMPMEMIEEQFRRMAFNIIARNQDDHVKNIAYLMDPAGNWTLSPAFDLTYSYNPAGAWTSRHQMTMQGKRDNFTPEDFEQCARTCAMNRNRAREILAQVDSAVSAWSGFASAAGVPKSMASMIERTHRLNHRSVA